MTKVFLGNTAEIIKTLNPDEVVYATTPDQFRTAWGQKLLTKRVILFVNISDKAFFQTVMPKEDKHLAWSEEIPRSWHAWAKRHDLDIKKLRPVKDKDLKNLLKRGIRDVVFTDEAIDWIVLQLSNKEGEIDKERLNNEITKFLILGQRTIDLNTAAACLGGQEGQLAAKIVSKLGQKESLALATLIPSSSDAVRLFSYLEKFVKYKHPWLLYLKACRLAADNLKFDYKTACIIFIHTVYQLCRLQIQKSSSMAYINLTLDLYQLCGISYLTNGNLKEL